MHLSIRTKALIFLSAILLIANAVWIFQNYKMISGYFDIQKKEIHDQHQHIINNVFSHTQNNLSFIALNILGLQGSEEGELFLNGILLDQDVLYAEVSDSKNNIVFKSNLGLSEGLYRSLSEYFIKNSSSSIYLKCVGRTCYIIFSFEDYMSNGEKAKVTLVKGVASELIDFNNATNSELILLQANDKAWVLATHFEKTKNRFYSLTDKLLTLTVPEVYQDGDEVFLIDPVNIGNITVDEIKLVAIKDITEQYTLFKYSVIEGIVFALILWLILQILLSYFILKSINQLQRVNTAVRFLPVRAFEKAKSVLKPVQKKVMDELDELERNTYEVSGQLEALTSQLVHMAHYDDLTQLPNRNAFYQDFRALLKTGGCFAISMININNLKQINDLYGHEAGDRIIQAVGKKLQNYCAEYPKLNLKAYRLGADEFILLFHNFNIDTEKFDETLERLTQNLTGEVLSLREEVVYFDSAVAGLIVPDIKSDEQDEKKIFYRLDLAMKKAKQGSNLSPWHLFDPERDDDSALVQHHLQLVDWIRDALAKDTFKLVFQPIVSLKENKTSHYEVLIRMFDPDGQFVSPAEFIPVAERYKLIRDIDVWVLNHAMRLLKTLPEDVRFAINLSAPSVQMLTLPDLIEKIVDQHGINPNRITLELTETAYVENLAQAKLNFEKIKSMGFKLALDDFGVGFTSFSHFSELPLDYVKIDGSYIKDLDINRRHQVFTQGLVSIIHAFNMQAIAEFVENDAIENALKIFETDYGQGYHFSKPLTEDELKALYI